MGGCHRICVGGGVFHQCVYLPELPDTHLVAGEDHARGRFPVREQDVLRSARAQYPTLDAAGATHLPMGRKELYRETSMGVQTTTRLGQGGERRYRGVQLPNGRHRLHQDAESRLLHPVPLLRQTHRGEPQGRVRRYRSTTRG